MAPSTLLMCHLMYPFTITIRQLLSSHSNSCFIPNCKEYKHTPSYNIFQHFPSVPNPKTYLAISIDDDDDDQYR